MDYSKHVNVKATPQNERTPGRDEVQNSAGGFVHQMDDWARLDRFLILGTEGGTYYVGEHDLTKDNAQTVIKLIKQDGLRVVNRVVEISGEGRAHKNDAALFVLAAALKLGDTQTRKLASGVMPQVARTGTMLFTFAKFVEAFGGWGRGTKRAFQRWYNEKDSDNLAYQLLKYRQRDGWSHRDILRLAHPLSKAGTPHAAIYDVTAHPEKLEERLSYLPRIYAGYEKASRLASNPDPVLIDHYNLSWEMLPTEWLNDEAVNKTLLKRMPLMATIRQLGKLTANGTIKPLSPEVDLVCARVTSDEQIAKSRIHPMHYLLALKNYSAGAGFRGSLRWSPDNRIIAALNEGFYKAFKNVEPTGKAFMIGVDVSSSMTSRINGSNISAAEAAGAMAMVVARTERNHFIHGFTSGPGGERFGYRHSRNADAKMAGFVDLGIGTNDALPDVMRKVQKRNFGSTDCAIPMLYARTNNIMVDTFVVITDNETWAGDMKPVDALRSYRVTHNPNAKLVVLATSASQFTIADPNDAGMLDISGFDASVPQLLAEFSR